MGKYDPLQDFLYRLPATETEKTLSFETVEKIINANLPKSAFIYRAWWANTTAVNDHPYAQAWLALGWFVESVNLSEKWVHFKRR